VARRFGYLVVAVVVLVAACTESAPVQYQGYVEGDYIRLAAPRAGQLQQLSVARGDTVAEGASLFTLEAGAEQAMLTQAQAQLSSAQAHFADINKGKRRDELDVIRAQLTRAQTAHALSATQLQRQLDLYEQGVASTDSRDRAQTQVRSDAAHVTELRAQLRSAELAGRSDVVQAAASEVEAAAAAVQSAQWALDQKIQRAPAAGLVDDIYFRVGEWVPAGTPVLALLPPAARRLRFFVPETAAGALVPGQAVTAYCDGCAEPVRAVISRVAAQAEFTPPVIYSREQRSRMVFLVEAVASPEQALLLRPGQPVDVELVR